MLIASPEGWRLALPWGDVPVPDPIPWTPTAPTPDAAALSNNLQYMEYLADLDDSALQRFVDGWITANPLSRQGAVRFAWRPYNLSLRVSAWAGELAARDGRLDPAFVSRMTASLAEQLRFLARHLETDLRGNHLIKNLKALLWGGAVFTGSEAEAWETLGSQLLGSELKEQILPDGCHYERSPAYHGQVLADLLECRVLLAAGPLRDQLDDALGRMVKAAFLLAHPDGLPAGFNDGGLHMAPSPERLGAVFEGLCGPLPELPQGAFALPDAGYWGLSLPGERLLIDCGDLGPSYLPGHGHCDLLSLEWSTGGARILVDQGTYQYAAGPRRTASRSTRSHNTLSLEGVEQSDIHGAFRCGRRAKPQLLAWEPHEGGLRFTGTHDGYARLPGQPRHVRRVESAAGRLVIADQLDGTGSRTAESRFLLHPECEVELKGEEGILRYAGGRITFAATRAMGVEPAEWYPDLYTAMPTRRLVLPVTEGGSSEIRFVRTGS
jgi:uncharacterized heparinase superfamily protein